MSVIEKLKNAHRIVFKTSITMKLEVSTEDRKDKPEKKKFRLIFSSFFASLVKKGGRV